METVERYYYQESMQKIDEKEKDTKHKEESARLIQEYTKHMNGQSVTIDKDKVKWFENLADGVLEFAKVCDIDVKIWTENDCYGNIRFETSYFELSLLEPTHIHKFWTYLCNTAIQFSISNCPKVVRIEFRFALHNNK